MEQVFRRAIFNYLSGVCDDHDKNTSFILSQDGDWHLAPAYDVTFTVNLMNKFIGDRHVLSLSGENRRVTRDDILRFAAPGRWISNRVLLPFPCIIERKIILITMKVKPVCIALGCLLIASSCDKERRPSTPGELETATAESLYGSLLSKSPRGYTNSNSTSASASEDFGDLVLLPGKNLCGYVRDSEGNGLAGVTVSDGYSCVSTNADGEYQMTANPAARTVSITVPAACEIPLGAHNQPAFWQPVVIPASGAVKKDFILKARADGVPSRFTILAVTDEHVQSENMLTKFVIPMLDIQNTARTLLSSGIPVGTPAHADAGEVIGISLGDQMWDNMAMADWTRNVLCALTDESGKTIPMFFTIGNHDYDSSKSSDYDSEQAYVDTFGPTNYSFDRGNAHIIVMDDIIRASGNGSPKNGYTPINLMEGFTSEQLSWLTQDIAHVQNHNNKIVIFCCHAPLSDASGGDSGTQSAIMGLLKNNFYNVHVLSGHTHCVKNNLYRGWAARSGRSIYEHTIQSLAGYFWQADISYGIASAAGYGVLTFGSSDIYAEYNKITKEDPSFQFWVYNGGETYTRSGASYSWPSPVNGKYVVRLPDAGSANDSSDYWTVTLNYGGSHYGMTRVSDAINDRAANCFIAKNYNGYYGAATQSTDQFWYSSRNFSGSNFTITATHTMPSGWSATFTTKTSSSYVKNNTFYGFGYRVNFE